MKKKSAKSARKAYKKKNSGDKRNLRLSKLLLTACLVLAVLYSYRFITYEIKSIKETPKSEAKKIPKDVAKNLKPSINQTYEIPILMYHYVEIVEDERDTFRKSMNIDPAIFESQIKTLSDAGYTFLTASELGSIVSGYRLSPQKAVVITFDDGHWDNATVVLPILQKYHAKATFYIIPGFTNGSDFLTDKQIREIINSNLVEIGSHTVHHISLSGKLSPVVTYEVTQSKKMLEEKYGIRVTSFAYPNGDFDQSAIDAVEKAGFTTAVSTIPGTSQTNQNRYFLYRLRPAYRSGEDLLNYFKQKKFKPYN